MRAAIDALLLAVIRLLLRALTPGGRVDALYAVNAAVDWDLHREEREAEKTAPALEGRGV
ncbi:hypothetical protein TthSNM11_09100 [Thermus thermophilus]|uniref:hypothetical protein n=1 Tax=Thermus thermophilus TaxID=274 RepID=UPI001FCE1788|nr:hypothetical protein [Thermus thermophilus]BDG18707.1 hypothetical protein TthSNM11_09100 [Thermus thermophilus]